MDTHSPGREDDLSDCERRLANWQPAAGRLDADAVLFAAGREAGRRRWPPLLWPTVCALLAVQAAGFGVWALSERAGRVILAGRLHEGALTSTTMPLAPHVVEPAEQRYSPSPDDYFHLRRRLEQEPGRWLASAQTVRTQAIGPPPPAPSILRAGQQNGLLP